MKVSGVFFPWAHIDFWILVDITTSPNAIQWKTHWNPQLEKTNCTNATMTETHTDTKQTVIWNIENPPQLD